MTNKEFFLHTMKDETTRTAGVFRALPGDKLDYKPDPKARTGAELAGLLAIETWMMAAVAEKGTFDPTQGTAPEMKTPEDMVGVFMKGTEATQKVLESMTNEHWETATSEIPAYQWKDKLMTMMWMLLLDGIHHRGQLSTYIRPMGGKVPSIYGPSADSGEDKI